MVDPSRRNLLVGVFGVRGVWGSVKIGKLTRQQRHGSLAGWVGRWGGRAQGRHSRPLDTSTRRRAPSKSAPQRRGWAPIARYAVRNRVRTWLLELWRRAQPHTPKINGDKGHKRTPKRWYQSVESDDRYRRWDTRPFAPTFHPHFHFKLSTFTDIYFIKCLFSTINIFLSNCKLFSGP